MSWYWWALAWVFLMVLILLFLRIVKPVSLGRQRIMDEEQAKYLREWHKKYGKKVNKS
jgi:hypothetical protein